MSTSEAVISRDRVAEADRLLVDVGPTMSLPRLRIVDRRVGRALVGKGRQARLAVVFERAGWTGFRRHLLHTGGRRRGECTPGTGITGKRLAATRKHRQCGEATKAYSSRYSLILGTTECHRSAAITLSTAAPTVAPTTRRAL